MGNPVIRVLLVDDDQDDYVLTREMISSIEDQRFELTWASTFRGGLDEIARNSHDVALVDFHLGERSGLELIRAAIRDGCKYPLVLLTGQGGREVDVEAMKSGAVDYLVKSRIDPMSLERTIRYGIERKRSEAERDSLIEELQTAAAKIKTMSGMLPICAACKRIRDDNGYWNRLEAYIKEHSHAEFSHSICPQCARQLYPDYSVSSQGGDEE